MGIMVYSIGTVGFLSSAVVSEDGTSDPGVLHTIQGL